MNPPLTRLPKKSKLYGWQCSECDKSSDSEVDVKEKGARRTRHSKENSELQPEIFTPKVKIKPVKPEPNPEINHVPNVSNVSFSYKNFNNTSHNSSDLSPSVEMNSDNVYIIGGKSGKKRRRDKHRSRYSPEDGTNPSKEHKRKRKKKSLDIENPNVSHPRITIKVEAHLFNCFRGFLLLINLIILWSYFIF